MVFVTLAYNMVNVFFLANSCKYFFCNVCICFLKVFLLFSFVSLGCVVEQFYNFKVSDFVEMFLNLYTNFVES